MSTKYHRNQYMNNEVSHDDYYGQFVTPDVLQFVKGRIGMLAIKGSRCEHMNDIPLSRWDALAPVLKTLCFEQVIEAGDIWSLGNSVCIAKQAARMLQAKEKAQS